MRWSRNILHWKNGRARCRFGNRTCRASAPSLHSAVRIHSLDYQNSERKRSYLEFRALLITTFFIIRLLFLFPPRGNKPKWCKTYVLTKFFVIVRKLTLSWAVTLSSWLKKVMMGLPASGGDPKIAWELCVVSHAYLLNGSAVFCIGLRNSRSSSGPEWFFMCSTFSSGSDDGNIKGKRIYIHNIHTPLCHYGYCELQLGNFVFKIWL